MVAAAAWKHDGDLLLWRLMLAQAMLRVCSAIVFNPALETNLRGPRVADRSFPKIR